MDQGDADILERIDAGERVFRPGPAGDRARVQGAEQERRQRERRRSDRRA